MRRIQYLTIAIFAAAAFGSGAAHANVCQAGPLTCATAMPVDGYCECTARGATESGTVVPGRPVARRSTNATAGGCGSNPNAPGCR